MKSTFIVLFVLLAISFASSRSVRDESYLISIGIDQTSRSKVLQLYNMTIIETSKPTYNGFLPCSSKVWGNLFLLVVYEYLLYSSEKYISSGSNLFFLKFGTGVFGASLFNILGMFPSALLILVSSFSSNEDNIRSVAATNMGLLAGSTILNLTIIWGSVVACGSYNLAETSCSANQENKRASFLTGFGVKTDKQTEYTARIMLLSIIPFLLVQVPKLVKSAFASRVLILISLVIALIFFVAYCIYQSFKPLIQDRALQYVFRSYVKKKQLKSLCDPYGRPDDEKIKKKFREIADEDHQIRAEELRAFLLKMKKKVVRLMQDSFVSRVIEEFDVSGDNIINESEFVRGIKKWLADAKDGENNPGNQEKNSAPSNTEDGMKADKQACRDYTKATSLILLGTAITILLTRPLMQTLHEFAIAVNLPSFLVSFVVVPIALNYKQGYKAIKSAARRKTEKNVSSTFSQIYSGVFTKNVFGLAIFLALVCIRNVAWDVSAEILVVVIICGAIGLSNGFSSKLPFWTSIIAYALYPISLAVLYALTTVYGWG